MRVRKIKLNLGKKNNFYRFTCLVNIFKPIFAPMTHLEEKIWHLVHDFCESQASHIPDQNRRFLMDMIKEMVEANGNYCPYCGCKKEHQVYTDANSPKICGNVYCKLGHI
jgi:hypothetical protein